MRAQGLQGSYKMKGLDWFNESQKCSVHQETICGRAAQKMYAAIVGNAASAQKDEAVLLTGLIDFVTKPQS